MAAIPSIFDNLWNRIIRANRGAPYVDITGTTNATLDTQTLFTHTLKDQKGVPVIPSKVSIDADGTGGSPGGQLYEMPANHTTTQVDIRAKFASVKFRARLWV